MPRQKAGAAVRHQSRGLTRTLPSSMDQAACVSHDDPDLWFPDRGDDDREQEALRICGECPARSACLAYVLSLPIQPGIWGGTTEDERRSQLKARAAS
jgi:WhiB family transcriptional regulator, redox-sensing transcriptional regulator